MACQQTTTACKDLQETRPLLFDFTQSLSTSSISAFETSVQCIVGEDVDPSDLLDGDPTIATSGKVIIQWLKDGIVDNVYYIRCAITTSDGRTLVGKKNIKITG